MSAVQSHVDPESRSSTIVWVQRAAVAGIWVAAIVSWQIHQSSNGLSTTETAQRFIDTVGGSWWGIFAYVLVYLARPIVLFPASILTIVGYSINDKIVVLDRVRENLRKYKKMPMKDLIDLSVNETLSRTIITGVTGLMALGVMAYYGGEALFSFAVSMFFGIVVGTYSSIYIAAPMLTVLGVGRRDNFQSADDKKAKKPRDEAYSAS